MKFFLWAILHIAPGIAAFAFSPASRTRKHGYKVTPRCVTGLSGSKTTLFGSDPKREFEPTLEDGYFEQATDFDLAIDAILDSMYKSPDIVMQRKAKEFEGELEDGYVQKFWLTRIINAWARSKRDYRAPEHASFILDVMKQLFSEGYEYVRPNAITYTSVMNAWVYSQDRRSPEKIHELYEEMRNKWNEGDESLRPTAATYSMVIKSLVNSREDDKGPKAEEILRRHWKDFENAEVDSPPDTRTYNAVLSVYAKGNTTEYSFYNTCRIVEEMWDFYNENADGQIKPNRKTMTHQLSVLANQKDITMEASQKADDIVKQMWKWSEEGDKDLAPNFSVYNVLLRVWLHNHDRSSIDRVKSIFNEMNERCYENKNKHMRPNVASYKLILDKLSRVRTEDGPQIAMGLLNGMWDKVKDGDHTLRPTPEIYYHAMTAIIRSDHSDRATKACEVLQDMIERSKRYPQLIPSKHHFQLVLNAYNPSRNSKWQHASLLSDPNIIVDLIEDMYKLHHEHGIKRVAPSTEIFADAMTLLIKHSSPNEESLKAAERLLQVVWDNTKSPKSPPIDTVNYLDVLTAWTRLKSENSVDHAEALYKEVCQRYESTRLGKIKPDLTICNAMMTAYARSKRENAAEKAKEIMDSMHQLDILPDVISYNSLLNAMSKSNATLEAETLLREMLNDQQNPSNSLPKPNIITFSTVINALSYLKSEEAAVRAQALLEEAWKLYEQGDETMRPNSFTYTPIISGWCSVGKPEKAKEALKEMVERDVTPNAFHYNYIITAFTKIGTQEAAKSAEALFRAQWTRLSTAPDIVAFQSVLVAWVSCNQPDMALSFFMEMIEDGFLPTSMAYNIIIEALENRGLVGFNQAEEFVENMWNRFEEYPTGRPNLINYTKLITVLTKSYKRSSHNANEAIRLFETLWQKSEEYPHLKPDAITYTVVLQAIAHNENHQKLYDKAKALYNDVQDRKIHLNRNFYGSYLNALVKSRRVGDDEISELFAEVEALPEGANSYIYNIVLRQYARKDIIHARAFLEEMWNKYNKSRDKRLKPNTASYVIIMSAYRRDKGGITAIRELVEEVERRLIEGDKNFAYTYEFRKFQHSLTRDSNDTSYPTVTTPSLEAEQSINDS